MPKAQWAVTGPVVKLASANLAKAKDLLEQGRLYLLYFENARLAARAGSPPRGPRFET